MSLKYRHDIFESVDSQTLLHEPADIRLISDRALIKDMTSPEKVGSIIIPEVARDRVRDEWGTVCLGQVISVGPGDRFIEMGFTNDERVVRKLITKPCRLCGGTGGYSDGDEEEVFSCVSCAGSGLREVLVKPQCHPGMTVLYSRRREAEVFIRGEMYSLVHAEQSVLAVMVIEDDLSPLYDRVLVERSAPETMYHGLHIPESAREKPKEGIVLGAGPGRYLKDGELIPLDVRRGDRVVFSDFDGTDVTLAGKSFTILRERSILAVIG